MSENREISLKRARTRRISIFQINFTGRIYEVSRWKLSETESFEKSFEKHTAKREREREREGESQLSKCKVKQNTQIQKFLRVCRVIV